MEIYAFAIFICKEFIGTAVLLWCTYLCPYYSATQHLFYRIGDKMDETTPRNIWQEAGREYRTWI